MPSAFQVALRFIVTAEIIMINKGEHGNNAKLRCTEKKFIKRFLKLSAAKRRAMYRFTGKIFSFVSANKWRPSEDPKNLFFEMRYVAQCNPQCISMLAHCILSKSPRKNCHLSCTIALWVQCQFNGYVSSQPKKLLDFWQGEIHHEGFERTKNRAFFDLKVNYNCFERPQLLRRKLNAV